MEKAKIVALRVKGRFAGTLWWLERPHVGNEVV